MAAARFNTKDHQIFTNKVFVLAGDGCLQEGISAEASAFAGHFGLDNLVVLYLVRIEVIQVFLTCLDSTPMT